MLILKASALQMRMDRGRGETVITAVHNFAPLGLRLYVPVSVGLAAYAI